MFLPTTRPPCVEDLHRQAKLNLKSVLRGKIASCKLAVLGLLTIRIESTDVIAICKKDLFVVNTQCVVFLEEIINASNLIHA